MPPRLISNSEVIAFQTCEFKHFLQFGLNLEPQTPSVAIYRGVIGHDVLAKWYEHFIGLQPYQKTEELYETAEMHAFLLLGAHVEKSDIRYTDELLKLRNVLKRYFAYAKRTQHTWIILQVEKEYRLKLTEDFDYIGKLDLVARINGFVTVVDHKFVYNMWSQDDLDLNPQLPKYLGVLRSNGITADRVMVNQIRYRVRVKGGPYSDEEMFRYSFSDPTNIEIRNHYREQIMISGRISRRRELSKEDWKANSTRVLSPFVCKMCSVRSLCIMDLQGSDIENEKNMNYQPNTYDYNSHEELTVNY